MAARVDRVHGEREGVRVRIRGDDVNARQRVAGRIGPGGEPLRLVGVGIHSGSRGLPGVADEGHGGLRLRGDRHGEQRHERRQGAEAAALSGGSLFL